MNQTNKFKFNFLDVIVVIILISLVISTYLQTNHQEITMLNIKSEDASIVVSVPGTLSTDEMFSIGDSIYLTENNMKIGTIENIESETTILPNNQLISEMAQNGNISLAGTLKHYNIYISASVKINEQGHYINGSYYIAPGKTICINNNSNTVVDEAVVLEINTF